MVRGHKQPEASKTSLPMETKGQKVPAPTNDQKVLPAKVKAMAQQSAPSLRLPSQGAAPYPFQPFQPQIRPQALEQPLGAAQAAQLSGQTVQ